MLNLLLSTFSKTAADCATGNFLGLVPWYKYLKDFDDKCAIRDFNLLGSTSDVPLVLLAVIDNLLRIAGLVAVIFVVYGAVLYSTSQGNPDQTSKAQSSIINALVGLVIAIIAVTFVTFLGRRLS